MPTNNQQTIQHRKALFPPKQRSLRISNTCRELTIQISPSPLTNPPPTLLLIHLQHPNLLQTLHHFPIYAPARIDVVRRARAAVSGRAVDFAHAAHADGFAEVDVAGDGGSADVEPEGGSEGVMVSVRCRRRGWGEWVGGGGVFWVFDWEGEKREEGTNLLIEGVILLKDRF